MQIRALAVVSLAFAACGPVDLNGDGIADNLQGGQPVVTAPVQSRGWITGEILDVHGAPISQAAVQVSWTASDGSAAAATAATQADGFFAVRDVPQSSRYAVTVSKAGFVHLVTTVAMPTTPIGTHPLEGGAGFIGRIYLLGGNGTFNARVIDSSGRPAAGAKAVIDVSPGAFIDAMSAGYLATSMDVTASATADATGLLAFSGVPATEDIILAANYGLAYAIKVSVDPIAGSGGASFNFDMNTTMFPGSVPLLQLPRVGATTAFALRSAPMDSLLGTGRNAPAYNMVGSTEPILLAFSHAVQESSLVVQLADEYAKQAIPTNVSVAGNVVTIAASVPLRTGAEYNLHVRAASADDGTVGDYVGFFFAGDLSSALPATIQKIAFHDTGDGLGGPPNGLLDPGELVDVTYDTAVAFFGALYTWAPPAIGYIQADLNGSTVVGDAVGEVGYSNGGFGFVTNEPSLEANRLFNPRASGYTTRWTLNYTGPGRVAAGTRVQLEPGRLDPSKGLTTLWGAPIVATDGHALEAAAP